MCSQAQGAYQEANVHILKGDYEKALARLDMAIGLTPENVNMHIFRASILRELVPKIRIIDTTSSNDIFVHRNAFEKPCKIWMRLINIINSFRMKILPISP